MKLGMYFEIDGKTYTEEQAKEIYEYLKGYFDKPIEQVPMYLNPNYKYTWVSDNAGGIVEPINPLDTE